MKGFVFLKRFPLKMSVLNENNDVFIYMQFYKILLYPSTGFAEKQCLLLVTLKILIKGLCVFFPVLHTDHPHPHANNKQKKLSPFNS